MYLIKNPEFRELVRPRALLVRMRTKVKNNIQGIMLMKGYSKTILMPYLSCIIYFQSCDSYKN